MFLTVFYMVATWIQSWRLASLRMRLSALLQEPQASRPTIMFHTVSRPIFREDNNGITKNQGGSGLNKIKDLLSSGLCANKSLAILGDLLWYQGDKRLCTIFPQQEIDVSTWLNYPQGKSIFPLFAHNYGQVALNETSKMHVLIEADLDSFNPVASVKGNKLEDYGLIVAWTSNDIFAVILETDLDHMTKFSTSLMHGSKCFINNGLIVTRVESVKAYGKPCVSNVEMLSLLDSKKLISQSQWDTYVKKLRAIGFAAKLVSQRKEPIQIKECNGIVISPGSKPISLDTPTVLEITDSDNMAEKESAGPSTPPPTPAANVPLSKVPQFLKQSIDLSPSMSYDSSATCSLSNLHLYKSRNALDDSGVNSTGATNSRNNLADHLEGDENESKMSSPQIRSTATSCTATPKKDDKISPLTMPKNFIKPPNILVYADSSLAAENIKHLLQNTVNEERYIVYVLSTDEAKRDIWMDQAALVVVCGIVGHEVASQLVEYIVNGGKLLALCSDVLNLLLPAFKTAEVRENELVRFSYGKWKHVRMLHHIFCYQASPVKTKFHDDSKKLAVPRTPEKVCVADRKGSQHTFNVKVLGAEETWQTPSILLAELPSGGGKAIFSQIHLEADPAEYELEETKFNALKESDSARIEIFKDLLNTHLDVSVTSKSKATPNYTPAFFLGRHELKLELLKDLKDKMQPNDVLKTANLEMQFCGTNTKSKHASARFLPILLHQCPENFSTIDYFENLKTKDIGRLVVYSDIVSSTMYVVDGLKLRHGLVVISREQTHGQGRKANVWLAPKGCCMFTLQLHVPLNSRLGSHISLIQCVISVACVHAVKSLPGYESIDLLIKWPNDIYTSDAKIGGLAVRSLIQGSTIIVNAGLGVNLANSWPTTCINDMIEKHNTVHKTKLKTFNQEHFLALVFTELESLLDKIQNGDVAHFLDLYYKYWMHSDTSVTVVSADGSSQNVKIQGIDDYGFLRVKPDRGKEFTVQPDGNSFDIFKGLIGPKM